MWTVQQVQYGTLIANHQRATFIENVTIFFDFCKALVL